MMRSLAVLAGSLALAAAPAFAQPASPAAAAPAGATSARPLVSAAWLRAHLHDPGLKVLDLRPASAHASGHVPGAVMADYEHSGWRAKLPDGSGGALPPIPQISAAIGGLGVTNADHVVLVGDDFGAEARIYWTFQVLGDRNVSILDGGWNAWAADKADPVQSGAVPVTQAAFTAHYDPSLRATLPEVEKAVATHDETLVDARPPAQWEGTKKTPVVDRYGHLPGAVWVDQTSALEPGGALKPKQELERIFAAADHSAKPVTTYCNTGHLAATDWFVLSQVLGRHDTKLYDASLSQWAHDPSRPMVTEAPQPAQQGAQR